MSIGAVSRTREVHIAPLERAKSAERAPPLLPIPTISRGTPAAGDAMTQLFALMSGMRHSSMSAGEQQLSVQDTARKEALQKQQEAVARALEEAENQGFWSDLGDIAGDVCKWAGRAAAVVGSAMLIAAGAATSAFGVGVGLVALGAIALSATTTGTLMSEGALGEKFKSAGMWLELGGAAASGGGGILASAAAGASIAANTASAASTATSAASGAAAGASTAAAGHSAIATAANVVSKASTITTASASVVAGTGKGVAAVYQHRIDEADAEGVEAEHEAKEATRKQEAAVKIITRIDHSNERALQALAEAMATKEETKLNIILARA